ncbi:hypothetical protein JCM11641_003293 [Rhodosporidiobolus odoratus]
MITSTISTTTTITSVSAIAPPPTPILGSAEEGHSLQLPAVVVVKTKTCRTTSFDEAPLYLQQNCCIRAGYRREMKNWKECAGSLTWMHNELANTWTHLAPAMFCFWFLSLLVLGTIHPSYLASHPHAAAAARYLPLPLLSPEYPSVTFEDTLVFGALFLGAAICFGLSAAYHCGLAHSERACSRLQKADYFGILLHGSLRFIPSFYYGFYCDPHLRNPYIALMMLSCSVGVYVIVISTKYQTHEYRKLRTGIFWAVALVAVIPHIHAVLQYGYAAASARMSFSSLSIEIALMLLGGMFYSELYPESLFPTSGAFDFFGNSHNIFHLFVVAAVATQWMGAVEGFVAVHGAAGRGLTRSPSRPVAGLYKVFAVVPDGNCEAQQARDQEFARDHQKQIAARTASGGSEEEWTKAVLALEAQDKASHKEGLEILQFPIDQPQIAAESLPSSSWSTYPVPGANGILELLVNLLVNPQVVLAVDFENLLEELPVINAKDGNLAFLFHHDHPSKTDGPFGAKDSRVLARCKRGVADGKGGGYLGSAFGGVQEVEKRLGEEGETGFGYFRCLVKKDGSVSGTGVGKRGFKDHLVQEERLKLTQTKTRGVLHLKRLTHHAVLFGHCEKGPLRLRLIKKHCHPTPATIAEAVNAGHNTVPPLILTSSSELGPNRVFAYVSGTPNGLSRVIKGVVISGGGMCRGHGEFDLAAQAAGISFFCFVERGSGSGRPLALDVPFVLLNEALGAEDLGRSTIHDLTAQARRGRGGLAQAQQLQALGMQQLWSGREAEVHLNMNNKNGPGGSAGGLPHIQLSLPAFDARAAAQKLADPLCLHLDQHIVSVFFFLVILIFLLVVLIYQHLHKYNVGQKCYCTGKLDWLTSFLNSSNNTVCANIPTRPYLSNTLKVTSSKYSFIVSVLGTELLELDGIDVDLELRKSKDNEAEGHDWDKEQEVVGAGS